MFVCSHRSHWSISCVVSQPECSGITGHSLQACPLPHLAWQIGRLPTFAVTEDWLVNACKSHGYCKVLWNRIFLLLRFIFLCFIVFANKAVSIGKPAPFSSKHNLRCCWKFQRLFVYKKEENCFDYHISFSAQCYTSSFPDYLFCNILHQQLKSPMKFWFWLETCSFSDCLWILAFSELVACSPVQWCLCPFNPINNPLWQFCMGSRKGGGGGWALYHKQTTQTNKPKKQILNPNSVNKNQTNRKCGTFTSEKKYFS